MPRSCWVGCVKSAHSATARLPRALLRTCNFSVQRIPTLLRVLANLHEKWSVQCIKMRRNRRAPSTLVAVPPLPLSSPVRTINPKLGVSLFPTGTVTSGSSTCSTSSGGHDTSKSSTPFQSKQLREVVGRLRLLNRPASDRRRSPVKRPNESSPLAAMSSPSASTDCGQPWLVARTSGRSTPQSKRLVAAAERRRATAAQIITSTSPRHTVLAERRRLQLLSQGRLDAEKRRMLTERRGKPWVSPTAHLPVTTKRKKKPPSPRTPRCPVCATPSAEAVEHYEAVQLVFAALGGGGGAAAPAGLPGGVGGEPLKCHCLRCGEYLGAVSLGVLTPGVRV